MTEGYWASRRVSRRSALRGAGLGFAGLAGAALIGCGSDDEEPTATATAAGTGTPAGGETPSGGGGGAVPADQVRVPPGRYDGWPAPTPAEMDPLANGRYGGTLVHRYLDPPHMDFNRTLSCTVNTTMDYTNNKLTRAKFGPLSNGNLIEIEPDLAESWEINGDATEFTFHLREGVKFQNVEPANGRGFDVEDVRLSYERYQAGGTQKDVFSEVTAFETPDDHTLVVKLSEPLVDFPRNIAAWSFIWPRELVADLDTLGQKAVGTGPFIQEEWTQKERSVFARNPEYFETGLPFLDRVITIAQNDTAVLRAGFLTNNFFEWSARDEPDAQDMLKSSDDAVNYVYEGVQGANSNVFRFQMDNPVLQDERVRRAVSMSIDRVGYAAARADRSEGFAKPSISWQALFDQAPTLADEGPWYQYDPQGAAELLSAAGYTADSPLSFEMTGFYLSNFYQFADVILPSINETVGLDVSYREVDNPTAVVLLNDRNFEWATGMTFGPPAYSVDQSVFPFYHSRGGLNFGNLNDSEMDSLVEQQRGEQNVEAQKEIWKKIWDRELDIVYDVFLPLSGGFGGSFFHNYVVNFRNHGIGSAVCYANSQIRSVWLDEGAPEMGAVLDSPGGGLL
ncbi:MAG: ABC transporter substrate-binding protein [Dehalococcoidia bacterium]